MCTFGGYNPDTEIPDLAGKVILITGGMLSPPAKCISFSTSSN